MIPDFIENGYLPTGLHKATIKEVIKRFGEGSDERLACGQSLQWLLPICRRAGIIGLLVNGSFVTRHRRPQDVGCVLLAGDTYDEKSEAAFMVRVGLPYLSLEIVDRREEFDFFVREVFGSDRRGRAKGIVEVIL